MKHLLPLVPLALLTLASCSDDNTPDQPSRPDIPGTPTVPDTPIATTRVPVKVLAYTPAPGQFINLAPEYTPGDTRSDIVSKANAIINQGGMVSLGAWGGNITFKLEKPVVNRDGVDFRVLGNAISNSPEPGVVLVSSDTNHNGLPDEKWYILAGEHFSTKLSTITYFKPNADSTDERYIRYRVNNDIEGYIPRNSYNTQSYWPQWISDEYIIFTGLMLPPNGRYDSTQGMYMLTPYWGYADSYPNNDNHSLLDISNARDTDTGNPVDLRSIDFVSVYTGVLQVNGPIGEISTEVAGIAAVND